METQATTRLAQGLGWFSLGLGLAEIAAPGRLLGAIGVDDGGRSRSTVRALGARELASGLGILTMPRRPATLWSRVAGDAMDLALLGWALGSKATSRQRLLAAIGAVLGVAALDVIASRRLDRQTTAASRPAMRAITVNRPPSEVYAFWRDLSRLPEFMSHLASVRELGDGRSHWVAEVAGQRLEWDAEIVVDRPGQILAWRTVDDSPIRHRGAVTFTPTPDGKRTEVRVQMQYDVPGGRAGAAIAKLTGGPLVGGDLRRFKQVLETGEILHSDASIHPGMHPARPSARVGGRS